MKALVKAIILTLTFGLFAPACLVRTEPYDTVALSVRSEPRCAPSRYWDGERCVRKRGHGHYHHRHWH